MQRPRPETVTLDDILITEELSRRSRSLSEAESPRSPNLLSENQALHTLARQLVHQPETIFQSVVDIAVDLCSASSAGVSLLELRSGTILNNPEAEPPNLRSQVEPGNENLEALPLVANGARSELETTPDGEEIFRWNVLAGTLAQYVGNTTPRHFSPCGVCLDRGTPQLFSHPERYFTYFQATNAPFVEVLVLPLIADNHALGTIWIVSHDEQRHFDSEDVRVLTSLADFTAAALLLKQRQTQELLAKNAQLEAQIALRESEERLRLATDEAQLREAQRRLELSLTAANLGIWTYNVSTDEFWADDRAKQMHGHAPHEVHNFVEAGANIHPSDCDRARAAIAQAILDRSKLQIEYRVIWRDGSVRWIASYAEFIPTGERDLGMFYGVVQDISDRQKAETAKSESEARLRALIENLPGGAVFVVDRDLRYLLAQGEALSAAGFKSEDLVGRTIFEALPPELAADYEVFYRRGLAGESFEREHNAHDRSYISRGTPLRSPNGEVYAVLAVSYDISDRKQAEAALAHSRRQFEKIAGTTPDLVYVFDLIEERNIYVNEGIQRVLGYSQAQIAALGSSLIGSLIHPDDIPGAIAGNQRFRNLDDREVYDHELRMRHASGEYRWLRCRDTVFERTADGTVTQIIGTAQDISDRKRAEAALRESEEKYRVLFETMDEGYLLSEVIFDENGEPIDILYLEANPAAVRLAGRDFSGQRMREIDPNYEEYWYEIYGRVALTGESMRAERYAEPHDRWFDFYAFKVGGQESRRVAIVFNDITAAKHREAERKRTEEQQTFLLKFSDMLRAEPDADSIANQAVRMLAEHLRLDRFWLSEVFEQQGISTVGPEYHRPDLPPMSGVFRLSDYPETMRQLATQPMVIHDVVNDPGFSDSEKAILSQLHLRSLLVASLREGQHQVIWALAAAMTTPRHWNESERVLLEKVSEFVWAAIGRARVEAALRESEAKYRTLFESIDQGYCLVELILNQEGKPIDWLYLEANPSYQRQTGLGDIVGKRLLEFVPNLEPEWFDFYGNVAQTGEPARLEYPVEAIGRWFTVYASRVGGEGSLLVAIVFEDITDRKRTETNLAFLAEISQDLVHLTNIDETMDAIGAKIGGHFHVARVIFSEISEDQETGRVSHEWHQPDLPDMKGTYATKAYFSPEFERLHRAGEIAVVRDTAKDQRVDGERYAVLGVGAFVGVPLIRQDKWRFYFSLLDSEPRHWRDDEIELLRELTTRIWTRLESARAEAALRESEARRHLAIEAAELGTFLYHPQEDRGEPDARMLALFGLGEGDTLNLAEAIANMIHPDDRELYAAAVATAVNPNGDGKFYAEIRVLHPDKSLHWVAVTAQTVFEGEPPQPVRMYGIAADITDRKQAEADRIQLIQEQANRLEAERMSQMKDEFVAMISHELQSPMVAVLGWTRLLRANLPPPAMLMKHLETIERNAMLQAKLIQDLLDISRISAGKLRLRLEPVELESAIETAIAAVLTAAIVKNISIQHPSTDRAVASVLVMGDRDRLQQVFCNLLTNAIKFTPEAGSVTVELSTIKAEKPQSASMAEIRVVDTGIGISGDFLPHVFDRFRQAEKSGSAGGLGLGLAIARHLVELHNGTIYAESAGVGQGATFIIKIPLFDKDETV